MQEVYEFLKKCGTYYLATVEGDQPRVRAFGTIDLFEGKLYIQTDSESIVKDVEFVFDGQEQNRSWQILRSRSALLTAAAGSA